MMTATTFNPMESLLINLSANFTDVESSEATDDPLLLQWQKSYEIVHGYVAAIVCFFGVCTNILNIVVLTRKSMRSATNCILTALAISDMLAMAAYLPFAIWFYIVYSPSDISPEKDTLASAHFLVFYASFSVVVHTISIWLTVTLAVFRYIYIRFPQHGSHVCSLPRAKLAVFIVYLVSLVISIPNFLFYHIVADPCGELLDKKCYYVRDRNDSKVDLDIQKVNFWVHALLIRLIPCIGLTMMSFLLVRTMKKVDERRRQMGNRLLPRNADAQQQETSSRDRRTQRTTLMLVTVVVMFIITEFPQGVIALLSGVVQDFFEHVYTPLGDFMDILTLVNNSINFILYCTMSKQFRDTFMELFWVSLKRTSILRSRSSNSSPNSVSKYSNGKTRATSRTQV